LRIRQVLSGVLNCIECEARHKQNTRAILAVRCTKHNTKTMDSSSVFNGGGIGKDTLQCTPLVSMAPTRRVSKTLTSENLNPSGRVYGFFKF